MGTHTERHFLPLRLLNFVILERLPAYTVQDLGHGPVMAKTEALMLTAQQREHLSTHIFVVASLSMASVVLLMENTLPQLLPLTFVFQEQLPLFLAQDLGHGPVMAKTEALMLTAQPTAPSQLLASVVQQMAKPFNSFQLQIYALQEQLPMFLSTEMQR